MRRRVPGPNGQAGLRLSVAPFVGGAETSLSATGNVVGAEWVDSVTIAVHSLTGAGSRFARTDVRTGAVSHAIQIADSTIVSMTALPNGWAWIPARRDLIVVEQAGQRHEIAKPAWYAGLHGVAASADGAHLLMTGWAASTNDTIGVDVVPTTGGRPANWSRSFAENGWARWLADGSIAFAVWTSLDAVTVRQVTKPGQEKPIGAIAYLANALSLSRDLKRATIMSREYRGDAWMYRVVKP